MIEMEGVDSMDSTEKHGMHPTCLNVPFFRSHKKFELGGEERGGLF